MLTLFCLQLVPAVPEVNLQESNSDYFNNSLNMVEESLKDLLLTFEGILTQDTGLDNTGLRMGSVQQEACRAMITQDYNVLQALTGLRKPI